MTDEQLRKKYPIGTKIKFIQPAFDTNEKGRIVGFNGNRPTIFLPTARKHIVGGYHPVLSDGTKFTWHCRWKEIEPLVVKGQQLLFAFME